MLLQTVLAVVLVAADTAAPAPQPSIPTIITVHSSPYCTALRKSIDPVLVGLMRDDALISIGQNAMRSMDHDFKYGGMLTSSWGTVGAASTQQAPGRVQNFDNRLHETSTALQHNIDVIETILANADTTLKPSNADEEASLASIKAQLTKIADQQKTAINLMNGTADTQELDEIFNYAIQEAPSDAIAVQPWHSDTLNGVSPLTAMLAKGSPGTGVSGDPTLTVAMAKAKAQASAPLQSPYERLANALKDDQILIGSYENTAAKDIIAGAAGCK